MTANELEPFDFLFPLPDPGYACRPTHKNPFDVRTPEDPSLTLAAFSKSPLAASEDRKSRPGKLAIQSRLIA